MAVNTNHVVEKLKNWEDRVSDKITSFAGSMKFVYSHLAWFGVWILINVGAIGVLGSFDPFPFGLLTLIVSLEAIFLSTFVMISQNRSAQREEVRAELDYETDVKAEKEIAYITLIVEALAKEKGLEVKDGKIVKKSSR